MQTEQEMDCENWIQTALEAVGRNDAVQLQSLLSASPQWAAQGAAHDDVSNATHLLEEAARKGSAQCARILLPWCAQDKGKPRFSAIEQAAERGHSDCLQVLLTTLKPAARSGQGLWGRSALCVAAMNGRTECVTMLLGHCDAKKGDKTGRTPLIWAVVNGHEDCASALLASSELQRQDQDGFDALMHAAIRGHTRIAKELLDAGAPIVLNEQSITLSKMSHLMAAVQSDSLDCVDLLLAHSPAQALRGSNALGHTVLHMAAETNENVEIVRRLMGLCDPHARDTKGRTPLIVAASSAAHACVEALLDVSDATLQDQNGCDALLSFLSHARPDPAHRGPPQTLMHLLPMSDLTLTTTSRQTALMVAAEQGLLECVNQLLPVSDPTAVDSKGLTAFKLAYKAQKWACVESLAPWVSPRQIAGVLRAFPDEALPRLRAQMEKQALTKTLSAPTSRKTTKPTVPEVAPAPSPVSPAAPRRGRRL